MTDATIVNQSVPGQSDRGKLAGPKYGPVMPFLLALLVVIAIIASLCIGAYPISFGRAADILFHSIWPFSSVGNPHFDLKELAVVQIIRLPRVLLATLVGIALGMSGTALQGMMRNPLVGPDLVGVTSGAALGGVMALLFEWPPIGVISLAFGGGLLAMSCTFGLAKLVRAGTDGIGLILSGIFVGGFFVACVGFVQYLAPDSTLPTLVYWLLGSLIGADPQKVWTLAIPTLVGGTVLMFLRWRLNLLSLGDLDAASLGINVKYLRWVIIAVVSLMVAAQVSVCGMIAWIGLVVPHCARMLVGPDHRRLLPAAALLGGLMVLGLDDLTRTIVQAEIPVGILTAIFGTPVICFLFWKTQSKGWING